MTCAPRRRKWYVFGDDSLYYLDELTTFRARMDGECKIGFDAETTVQYVNRDKDGESESFGGA